MREKSILTTNKEVKIFKSNNGLKRLFQIKDYFVDYLINFKKLKRKSILEKSFQSDNYLRKILPEKDFYLNEFKKIFYSNNPFCFTKKIEKSRILKLIENDFSTYKSKIISLAKSILKNQYNILGRKHQFSNNVDWFYSLFNNLSWPIKRSSKINWMLDSNIDIDLKFTLRLNYHQEFVILGQAFYLTKDEKYTEKFYLLILDWIKKNPPNYGVNWIDFLEISHRIIFWIFAISFFKNSKILTDDRLKIIAKSLYQQVYFIKINNNKKEYNHTIGEHFAIFLFSKIFKSIDSIKEWYKKSKKVLLKQIKRQTQEDGVNIEQTSNYHRMVLEIFTLLVIIDSEVIHSSELNYIERMFEFWKFIIKPDTKIPLIGDSDDAHFIPMTFFNKMSNINLDLLNLGAVLFNRSDFKINYNNEIIPLILLLLGTEKLKIYNQMKFKPAEDKIKFFHNSGFVVGKSDWSKKANYIFFDMGQFGPGISGHDHSDISNIIYSFKGKPILIDSGTYMYNIKVNRRNIFRSSKAHNVLSINYQNQATITGTWGWKDIPIIKRKFIKDKIGFSAILEHDGYKNFLVRRRIMVSNNINSVKVIETIIPLKKIEKKIIISLFFHFPMEVPLEINENYLIIDSNLKLEFQSDKKKFKIIKNNFPYSPYYGFKKESQLIEFNIFHNFNERKILKIKYILSSLHV